MLVRELADGLEIDQILLVRERSRGSVKLGDRTGCVRAAVPSELGSSTRSRFNTHSWPTPVRMRCEVTT